MVEEEILSAVSFREFPCFPPQGQFQCLSFGSELVDRTSSPIRCVSLHVQWMRGIPYGRLHGEKEFPLRSFCILNFPVARDMRSVLKKHATAPDGRITLSARHE